MQREHAVSLKNAAESCSGLCRAGREISKALLDFEDRQRKKRKIEIKKPVRKIKEPGQNVV